MYAGIKKIGIAVTLINMHAMAPTKAKHIIAYKNGQIKSRKQHG
jgi:hypothetical protein